MGNKWRALNERKKDPRTICRKRKKNKTPVASTTTNEDIADKSTPLPIVIPPTSLSPVITSIASPNQEASTAAQEETASARKIKAAAAHKVRDDDDDDDDDVDNSCYILMDTGIMSSIFSELITCPRCHVGVDIVHCIAEKQGLAHLFNIKCRSLACQWNRSFYPGRKAD